mgnify:CR=1 FL=1
MVTLALTTPCCREQKKLQARSERVKCVDFHPTEPWVLSALYSGHVFIWNYQTQTLVKSIEVGFAVISSPSSDPAALMQVCELPVRCARFIAKKQWILTGSDVSVAHLRMAVDLPLTCCALCSGHANSRVQLQHDGEGQDL